MKAVGIVGSARANGSCGKLVSAFLEGWQAAGGETELFCLGQAAIGYCRGCKACYRAGQCVQQDDVEGIVRAMLSADAVVLAAPSYWGYVPGQMKTFFDRCTPYGNENAARVLVADHPIRGVGIAVRAGGREQENQDILGALAHFGGHMGITLEERISVTRTETPEDLLRLHADVLEQLRALGRQWGGVTV